MITMHPTFAVLGLAVLVAAAPQAQAQRAARLRGGVTASDLIDLRRQLDLTPRQVARLDSMERQGVASRRQLAGRLQARRDSACASRRPCVLTPQERAALLDWVDAQRPSRTQALRNDSLVRSRVLGVLDSTQRARLFDRREGRRALAGNDRRGPGFGSRGSMWPAGRMAPDRGFRGGRQPVGPRGPRGFEEGRRRPGFAPYGGMRPGFAPGGRMRPGFGPEGRMRRGFGMDEPPGRGAYGDRPGRFMGPMGAGPGRAFPRRFDEEGEARPDSGQGAPGRGPRMLRPGAGRRPPGEPAIPRRPAPPDTI